MDSMKEAFKRHISKHMSKGKPVADDAENPTGLFGKDDDPTVENESEHAPSLEDGDADLSALMMGHGEGQMHQGHDGGDLLEKIKKAILGAGDHMGRSAMGLNERAKDHMMKKMKK